MDDDAEKHILRTVDPDARRAAPKNRIAIGVLLLIYEDRRPHETKEFVVRKKPQADGTADFAIADLQQKAEVGAEAVADVIDEEAHVVLLFEAIPVRMQCVRCRTLA